jgi:hypothetical protein
MVRADEVPKFVIVKGLDLYDAFYMLDIVREFVVHAERGAVDEFTSFLAGLQETDELCSWLGELTSCLHRLLVTADKHLGD